MKKITFNKTAKKSISFLFLISLNFIFLVSCSQTTPPTNTEEKVQDPEVDDEMGYDEPHQYGGWYCPDNFFGFPPINAKDLHTISVVKGRLPSKEETRNGISLMYFDTTKIPSAKPLDIKLPQLAKYKSPYSNKTELVIVIQATIAKTDTVVGFRFLNGGNGSSWLHEVQFLSDQEIDEIGTTPFVYLKTSFQATKEEIWKAFTQTKHAKKMSQEFNENAFLDPDWENYYPLKLTIDSNDLKANGSLSSLYGNTYMQIDYTKNGIKYVEKLLIVGMEDHSEIHIVAGPFPQNLEKQESYWKNWLNELTMHAENSN